MQSCSVNAQARKQQFFSRAVYDICWGDGNLSGGTCLDTQARFASSRGHNEIGVLDPDIHRQKHVLTVSSLRALLRHIGLLYTSSEPEHSFLALRLTSYVFQPLSSTYPSLFCTS